MVSRVDSVLRICYIVMRLRGVKHNQGTAMKFSKTTALGFISGLMLLLGQVAAVIDKDPTTELSYTQIGAALALMGFGYKAQDNSGS